MSMGRWPGSSMMTSPALPIDLSSASNLLSSLAFLKRMTRLEAVKNLTGIMRWHASMPIAMARWVLPQPTSPWSTSSSARSTNSGLSSCSRPRSVGNEAMPPVVAVKRLVPGEPGLSGQPPPFGSGPARVLLPEPVVQAAEPAGRGVLQGLPGHAVRQRQVARQGHALFRRGLVRNAAAALPRFLLAHSASFMYLS